MTQAATSAQGACVCADDVRRICGPIPDEDLVAILSLRPSFAELEAGAIWAATGDPAGGRPLLSGTAARLADILCAVDQDQDDRPLVRSA
jgi:hypothetical protein